MKKVILLILIYSSVWSQQKMNTLFEARYELKFKEYKNQNDKVINNFILLFNQNESFFKNMNVYVKDSLFDSGKIKYTGGQEDLNINMKYYVELPFNVYRKRSEINFSNELAYAGELSYKEDVDFDWKVSKETKVINGVKCTKATTKKWGRNWIAYFSQNHPIPFGPYKFYGLPGLIFQVADDNNDYVFTLYKYKKRKTDNFVLHNYSKAKKVTKKQYEKARHDAATRPFPGSVAGDPGIAKRITNKRIEKEKNYNPIELTD